MNGKLIGGLILARWLHLPPGLLATILIPSGVLGIAVVLNVQQVMGTGDTLLLSAITIVTVVSEIFVLGIWRVVLDFHHKNRESTSNGNHLPSVD
jgi:hypothetical protein